MARALKHYGSENGPMLPSHVPSAMMRMSGHHRQANVIAVAHTKAAALEALHAVGLRNLTASALRVQHTGWLPLEALIASGVMREPGEVYAWPLNGPGPVVRLLEDDRYIVVGTLEVSLGGWTFEAIPAGVE